jgi:hypothetical protein
LERRSPPPAPSAASSVAPSDAQDWAIGIDDELPGLLALCVSADCGVIVYHAHGSSLSSGRPTGCMLFAYSQPVRSGVSEYLVGERMVVLHTFVKKTEATPEKDLGLARHRVKEVGDG